MNKWALEELNSFPEISYYQKPEWKGKDPQAIYLDFHHGASH